MSNFVMEPIPENWEIIEDFRFLVAIKDPVWYSKNPLGRQNIDKSFIKGSVCWAYSSKEANYVFIKGHHVNYNPNCFKEISIKDIEIKDGDRYNWVSDGNKIEILTGSKEDEPGFTRVVLKDCKISYKGSLDTKENHPVTPEEALKSKYRFKTEEEFKRDGLWFDDSGVPEYWNSEGKMNHYIGKPISSDYNITCDNKKNIVIHDESAGRHWTFRPQDYVLNDSKKDSETTSKIIVGTDPAMYSTSGDVKAKSVYNGYDMIHGVFDEIPDILKNIKKESKNKTESYTFTKSKNIVI